MRQGSAGDWITLRALAMGMAAPILYYGIQVVAAPFFPGFSFVGTTASELGSDLSRQPSIFNVGTMLLGVVLLLASVGFVRAFQRLRTHPALAWPISIAVAVTGFGRLWAGYYPLPNPKHAGHPAFLIAMLSLPPLFAASLWRFGSLPLKTYLLANLLLLAMMVPIMSGMSGMDTHEYRGILQRVFALTVFLTIGVAAYVLFKRVKASLGDPSAA